MADVSTKHTIKVGQLTNTSGETITLPSSEDLYAGGYVFADIIANVTSITGTSFTIALEEEFSGAYLQTGISAAITATGVKTVPQASNPLMGRGGRKRVKSVTTSISALVCDVYLILYKYD